MNKQNALTVNVLLTVIGIAGITQMSHASSLTTSSINSGGDHFSAAGIEMDACMGLIGELSSNQAETLASKNGYAGQLVDLTSIDVSVASASVDEAATCQFNAIGVYDDLSRGAIPGEPDWTILNGPLIAINSTGLATAGNVFQNTFATVRSMYENAAGQGQVLVVNVGSDDFGLYAMDGLPDNWQVHHFGINNTNAAATLDPDGDGYDNIGEYVAGTAPTNGASYFKVQIRPVAGMPSQMEINFLPTYSTRDYFVERTESLFAPQWDQLVNSSVMTNGLMQTARDLAATNSSSFYRVRIVYAP